MNIKVLPYINTSSSEKTSSAADNASSVDSSTDFNQVLDTAKKATVAMAIDKLVQESSNGSVDTVAVQQFFDQNGINIRIAASSTADSSSATTVAGTSVSADSTAANSTTTAASTKATASSNSSVRSTVSGLECSAELDKIFNEAAQTYGVDVTLLKAIGKCESNFSASALSGSGAMGIMQLMPTTASSLGVTDPYDAYQNIMGGAKLISQFLSDYNQNISLALAAYNAGPGNVKKYGGIPPFKETQNYVKKVLSYCE